MSNTTDETGPFPGILTHRFRQLLFLTLTLLSLIPPVCTFATRANWQQHVRYELDVTLDDSLRAIHGTATITYRNNSPDTLNVLWFRLPPAALRGGSVVDTTEMRGRLRAWSRLDSTTWGNLDAGIAHSEDDHAVSFEQDYSVGRLHIDPPLLPGDSVIVTLPFTTTFPTEAAVSRIAYVQGQYQGAYWYPMICPYTPEWGWTVNRYFGTAEAYGEFGDFTIRYTVPNRFIVASTGELVNEAEVLPPERLRGIFLDNLDPDPIPGGEEGDRLVTWIFQADRVPDVAFVMDPQFLINRVDFGHFEAWSFSRRNQTEDWSDAAAVAGWTISELEKIYGRYPWPRVQVTYSWSGMEFPMLTMISEGSPEYVQLIIHEVTHNYTPMILHSNSVDEQWIDEGFTTFMEHCLLTRYEKSRINKYTTRSRGLFTREMLVADDDVRGQRPYLQAVLDGEDLPMVRGGDIATDYPLLRVSSYYKTPVMLNTLRGVIGEDAFWRGFHILYQRHALTHVGQQDIISSFEDASARSLKWFFDPFLYSSEDLDYALEQVDFDDLPGRHTVSFDVRRLGGIRLPLLIGVITDAGDTLRGEIPFLSSDPMLERYTPWAAWDQLHMPDDFIHLHLNLPKGAKGRAVLLDPDGYWTDRSPGDNRRPGDKTPVVFDPVFLPMEPQSVNRWQLNISPALGFDQGAGTTAGASFRGSYLQREHVLLADVLVPSRDVHLFAPQFRVGFAHPVNRGFGPVYATIYGGMMHGDKWGEIGLWRSWQSWNSTFNRATISMKAGSWWRDSSTLEAIRDAAGQAIPEPSDPKYNQLDEPENYLRAQAELSGTTGGTPWRQSVSWTIGLDHGFNIATWDFNLAGRLPLAWTLEFQSRGSLATSDPPARFRDTPGGAAPYRLLGSPLFGGAWGLAPSSWAQYHGNTTVPRIEAPASFASDLGSIHTPGFFALSLSQTHKFPGFMRNTGEVHLDRFLDRLHLGIYESGLIFENPVQGTGTQSGLGVETGVEAGVADLYGLTLTARLSPWYGLNSSGFKLEHPSGWNTGEWLDHTVLFVDLGLDKYFR